MSRAGPSARLGLAAGLGALALFAASILVPVSRQAGLSTANLPADPGRSARLTWRLRSLVGAPVPFWPFEVGVRVVEGSGRVRLVGQTRRQGGPAQLEVGLRPSGEPGRAVLELSTGLGSERFTLELLPPDPDADRDGFPDAAELRLEGDRQAFRGWFTAIAEAQFYALDPRWEPVHRDCAGLLRFAYKEALRSHDADWLARTPYLHHAGHRELRAFHYPQVPVLGTRLFRQQPGAFLPGPQALEAFGPTASAQALRELSCAPVGKDADRALPGDLLFFRDPEHREAPMHSMILLDPPAAGRERRVVYHTGAGADGAGEVRLVRLADLDEHLDDRWRPIDTNPNFLGYYRWKSLEGGPS